MPLEYAQDLCDYWRDALRLAARARRELNAFPQFRTSLDGGGDDASTSTSCTCARPTPTRCRWCSPTAGRARSSSSSTSSAPLTDPPRTAATRPTRSTSCARRCPATGSATSRRVAGLGRRAHRGRVGRADGPPRLRPLRRAGRRLGLADHRGARLGDPRARRRHPPQHADGAAARRPTSSRSAEAEQKALVARKAFTARRAPATPSSSRPGRRRSATGSSTRPSGCAPGSSRSSGTGPTATATRQRDPARPAARQRDALLAARHRRRRRPGSTGRATGAAGWTRSRCRRASPISRRR